MNSPNNDAGAGLRILIVEDNVDSAETLQMLLAILGYDARTAYDGAAALALSREWSPQAVLCDIGLPDMDGYHLARGLRALAETRTAFLVALTGHGLDEDRARARDAGFDGFQVKPMDPQALQRMLSDRFPPPA